MLEKVQEKFVIGESIGGATTYVESKNAEVGFTALSMLGKNGIDTPTMSFVAIDEKLYKPIEQALIITNYGKDSKLAQEFKDYILGQKGKENLFNLVIVLNNFVGILKQIQSYNGISRLTIEIGDETISVLLVEELSLELIGQNLELCFKETNVLVCT